MSMQPSRRKRVMPSGRVHPPAYMHRCLHITELLREVANNLAPDDTDALLQMALTCRTFLNPAMDALWRTVWDTRRVLCVLPAHTLGNDGPEKQLKLVQRPSEADWNRFNWYARRVEDIDDSETAEHWCGTWSVPLVHWPSVVKYFPGRQIFPNLRRYTICSFDEAARNYVPLFLRSPLRHLSFSCFFLCDIGPVMKGLPNCAQTLETLAIATLSRDDYDHPQVEGYLFHTISALQALVSLKIPFVTPTVLEHLATLPTLRELCFEVLSVDNNATRLLFPALEALELQTRTDNFEPIVALIQHVVAPVLRTLKIRYDVLLEDPNPPWSSTGYLPPKAAYMRVVLKAISKLSYIKSFSVECLTHQPRTTAEYILDAEALSPLLLFRGLESLDLRSIAIDLDSDDVRVLAHSWPAIQFLRLGDSAYAPAPADEHFPSYLCHGDLLNFVYLCPHLATLGLPMDIPLVWRPHNPLAILLSEKRHHALEELYFAYAPSGVLMPDSVAFLAAAFPNALVKCVFGCKTVLSDINALKSTILDEP